MSATIAEFLLQRAADSRELARRARVLAALAQLPARRRQELAEAVGQVCREIASRGGTATVRFEITQRDGQPFVEVVVRDRRPAGAPDAAAGDGKGAAGLSADQQNDLLERVGEMLDHFQATGQSLSGVVIQMGQALSPSFHLPSAAEVSQWSAMLNTRSAEDALVMALQHSRLIAVALGHARHQAALQAELGHETRAEHLTMLSLVASKSRNAIALMRANGAISWVNGAFAQMTGYRPIEAKGRRPDELLFGPGSDASAVRALRLALREGHDLSQDAMLYRRDGQTFWAECDLIPVHDAHERLVRWIAIYIDITRRHETEEALRKAKEHAEASSRTKSEFLANMSHEIRTPMNAIIGMTELALATELTGEQREYLTTVQVSADALLKLLNDILDLSKIEAGRLTIDQVQFNLADAIHDTLRAMAVKAHQRQLTLVTRVPTDLPQQVVGDPVRLKQILFNLVGNAIKFSQRGDIVVEVEEQWRSAGDVGLHFAIHDQGIGIAPEQLERIFDAFTQADATTTRQYGGTGLGLTITAKLVRLMQGKIWVQSEPGEGSTFHFSLQMQLADTPTATASDAELAGLAGRRVLVVSQRKAESQLLDQQLRNWQLTPIVCDDLAAATAALADATRNANPLDLVLLSATASGVDAFKLLAQLREKADLGNVPILLLAAADPPDRTDRCRDLGISQFLLKPVSAARLLDAIAAALDIRRPPGAATASAANQSTSGSPDAASARVSAPLAANPEPVTTRPLKVLVADDQTANRRLAATVLSKRGHRCVEATDGDEALNAVRHDTFDVLLLDVQMPRRDGFAVTAAIRAQEQATGAHLPIIALTAHAMAGDRQRCLAAGMDAYLAKPLRPRELVALVEQVARSAGAGGTSAAGGHDPGAAGPAEYDFSAALASMDDDVELLVEQMEFFLSDAPALMTRIKAALDASDGRALELAAHRLKGLVSRYQCDQATSLAYELELQGNQGQLDGSQAVYDQLAPRIGALVSAIRQYVTRQEIPRAGDQN